MFLYGHTFVASVSEFCASVNPFSMWILMATSIQSLLMHDSQTMTRFSRNVEVDTSEFLDNPEVMFSR